MKTAIEILNTRQQEIIDQTIELLPNAFRGDKVNRTFFFKYNEETDEIIVDYHVYCGSMSMTDNCFLTIKDNESIDLEEYGVSDYDEIDYLALSFDDKIREAIIYKIEYLQSLEMM